MNQSTLVFSEVLPEKITLKQAVKRVFYTMPCGEFDIEVFYKKVKNLMSKYNQRASENGISATLRRCRAEGRFYCNSSCQYTVINESRGLYEKE